MTLGRQCKSAQGFMDERLRRLEREAANGDIYAANALIRARVSDTSGGKKILLVRPAD